MTANVLNAIIALSTYKNNNLGDYASNYSIRINAVGERLEYYVKDLLTGKFYKSSRERDLAYSKHFSYLGNQNNAVDAIAKGGDAFEIKKIESRPGSQVAGKIALNNSPPKDVLHRDDPRLRKDVREIDGGKWDQKDLFYVVGSTSDNKVNSLYFVQGTCYAARSEVYQDVFKEVKRRVSQTVQGSGMEFQSTKELGRVHRVDPLGITDFRLRGMWEIKNPADVFESIAPLESNAKFTCYAIMEEAKYKEILSLQKMESTDFLQAIDGNQFVSVKREQVKDPNNPAKLKDAVLIKVAWQ
ncbi:MAG: NgoPII family restriction endonuclease [Candidatus Parvarchaeota archaeon]